MLSVNFVIPIPVTSPKIAYQLLTRLDDQQQSVCETDRSISKKHLKAALFQLGTAKIRDSAEAENFQKLKD